MIAFLLLLFCFFFSRCKTSRTKGSGRHKTKKWVSVFRLQVDPQDVYDSQVLEWSRVEKRTRISYRRYRRSLPAKKNKNHLKQAQDILRLTYICRNLETHILFLHHFATYPELIHFAL